MDFKESVNKLEQDLKDFLSDTSPGAQIRQTPVEKLQAGSYTGISITPADTNVGMNINADQLYAQMQEGRSYEGVLAMALSQVEHGMRDMPAVDIQSITNYETAKNLLCFEVGGTEQNADMLANIPHTDMENMSMVYRFDEYVKENGKDTPLPRLKDLHAEYAMVLERKKKTYAAHRKQKSEMQDYLMAQKIVEVMLEKDGREKERERQQQEQNRKQR